MSKNNRQKPVFNPRFERLQIFSRILTLLMIFTLFLLPAKSRAAEKLDLNRASYDEIAALPVSEKIARELYERIEYQGYFTSIYQLRDIPGMDVGTFNKLKDLVKIVPVKSESKVQERIERIYYRLERWSSNEGINSDFIDLWIEKALEPIDINSIRYEDLVNLQNVSPVDAVAILNQRQITHWFRNERDLRYTPGLSNYAFRSVRYFVQYREENHTNWHGNVLLRMDNTPFMATEAEQSSQAQNLDLLQNRLTGVNQIPSVYSKARFTKGKHLEFGVAYIRTLGEPMHYALTKPFHFPKVKYNFIWKNLQWKDLVMRRLILGYYKVTLGQGVVMENTDFFTPRKSGYGFRKRFNGLSGDLSRTREFTLRGLAFELDYRNLRGIGFVSYDSRDAILNKDKYQGKASFNHFVVLDQRFPYTPGDSLRGPDNYDLSWLNAVKELTYGGHLQYTFTPGTFFGMSYYESAYDRYLDPNPYEIVGQDNSGNQNWDIRQVTADSEIKQAYGGAAARGSNPFWNKAISFRRVYGFNFQTVWRNIALQGEYGILDKSSSGFRFGAGPRALVASVYWQQENFNVLALYRDYALGFDNPYQRSFSNYRRYKGTIFEDYYYLQSPLYGQLYINNPQPQAEQGFYLNTYYQMLRQVTLRMEYDNWLRKSDRAKNYRLVGTVDYRPVYPLVIQLRQKWQAREPQNDLTPNRFYKNYEFRGRLRFRLSNYDAFDILYANSKLIVHPRPRVFGDMALDGEAIAANYSHNFNRNFRLSGMLAYYKGFFWNFEETQFVVMDSRRGALRFWLSVYSRLTSNLSVRLKYTADHHKPINNIRFEPWQSTLDANKGKMFAAPWNRSQEHNFYLELNYNF
ncbi:MAG: helix-hairpin-helix domain-containing protein [Calditrichaeota bacterium]|nr:helix-hairpin-helix domain-containing protein [Calditrichota bacterium]